MQATAEIADLDPGDTLTGVEAAVAAQRCAEVALLRYAAHWADLHGDHTGLTRGHGSTDGEGERRGHPEFRRFGGEGTPWVGQFAPAELGVSLRVHPYGARSLIGDALDLRHRLAPLWEVMGSQAPIHVWVLRKIASKTRHLPAETAELIAADLAPLLGSLPAGRLLERLESLIMLADAALDEAERQKSLGRRFVTFNQSGARGLKGLYAKLAAADAIVGDAQIQRLAELLLAHDVESGITPADLDPVAVARSRALGLLIADPAAALHLIAGDGDSPVGVTSPGESSPDPDRPTGGPANSGAAPRRRGRAAVMLHLHLSEDALQMLTPTMNGTRSTPATPTTAATAGTAVLGGVGRLEGHGPMNLLEALELLRLTQVTIRPVIDPAMTAPTDSYAFTGTLREAVLARTPADVYPYGVCTTHTMDIDHSEPFLHHPEPPVRVMRSAQTRLANAGPMTRHHHRIKTHGPMQMRQPLPDIYVWRTRHGRYRMTDATGTHDLDPDLGSGIFSHDPLDISLSKLMLKHRLGLLEPA